MKKNWNIKSSLFLFFCIYLIVLIWIILFKFQFSLTDIDRVRDINLVPFRSSSKLISRFQFEEIRDNLIIFIPFGIYLASLFSEMSFMKKISIISGSSLCLEIMQYSLSVGISDVTDILSNSVGGIIGIVVYKFLFIIFNDVQKVDYIVTIVAGVGTLLFLGVLSILLLVNK